jgi:phosphoglycolate phosphatase/pyrophosphatase PpaX
MALAPSHYEQALADYLRFYDVLHHHCPAPFEGITELLDYLQLHGLRIAMVTGKGPKSSEISLNKFGIKHYFSPIETGSPHGPVKAERIESVVQGWADLTRNEILYIGDAPSDITASRKAGIPVVAAAWAETAEPEKLLALEPDGIFYGVGEFGEWVKQHITHNH